MNWPTVKSRVMTEGAWLAIDWYAEQAFTISWICRKLATAKTSSTFCGLKLSFAVYMNSRTWPKPIPIIRKYSKYIAFGIYNTNTKRTNLFVYRIYLLHCWCLGVLHLSGPRRGYESRHCRRPTLLCEPWSPPHPQQRCSHTADPAFADD